MITVPLASEVILTGTFQIKGKGDVGNLDEFVAPPFPVGPGFPPAPFPHGNVLVNRLIHVDQDWSVKLNWTVGGIMAHAVNPKFKWEVEVLLEQWGKTEFELPEATRKTTVDYGTGTPAGSGTALTLTYTGVGVRIPAKAIGPGVYDVVAVLRLLEADGKTPCFLAAFAEFGKVDFYEGH
jgi:hypothetical protein